MLLVDEAAMSFCTSSLDTPVALPAEQPSIEMGVRLLDVPPSGTGPPAAPAVPGSPTLMMPLPPPSAPTVMRGPPAPPPGVMFPGAPPVAPGAPCVLLPAEHADNSAELAAISQMKRHA